jgi:hypothetical protein
VGGYFARARDFGQRAGEDVLPHRLEIFACEWIRARERFVQRDAEAVLIAARIAVSLVELLGRNVHRRAHHRADLRELEREGRRAWLHARRRTRRLDLLGRVCRAHETEIDDAGAPVLVDEHVVGFEVAMNEAGAVCRCETAARLHEHVDDLGGRSRALGEPLPQRSALDELHRDEELVVDRGADVVDRDHVRVREPCDRLRLAQHASATAAVLKIAAGLPHQLECDLAIELGVVGGIHDAHTAGADHFEHEIATDRRAACEVVGSLERCGRVPETIGDGVGELGLGRIGRASLSLAGIDRRIGKIGSWRVGHTSLCPSAS